MARNRKAAVQNLKSFKRARRRALGRLQKGLDLRWTPAKNREELHRRERDAACRR